MTLCYYLIAVLITRKLILLVSLREREKEREREREGEREALVIDQRRLIEDDAGGHYMDMHPGADSIGHRKLDDQQSAMLLHPRTDLNQ